MSTTIIRGPEAGPQRSWRHWLTGKPLATAEAPHQTISKKVGVAVFASDALSSTAYATDDSASLAKTASPTVLPMV